MAYTDSKAFGYNAVVDFDASPSNSASANDTAFAAAITACEADNKPLYIPAGSYDISAPIDATDNGTAVYGDGPLRTIIEQQDATLCVMKHGGTGSRLEGLMLQHATTPTVAQTGGNGLELYNPFVSTYRNLIIQANNRSIYLPQSDGGGDFAGSNIVFGNVFDAIQVYRWSNYAVDCKSYNGGSTGNVWNSIHCSNNPGEVRQQAVGGIYLQSMGQDVWNALHLEHTKYSGHLINLFGTKLTLNGINIESVEPTADFKGIFNLGDADVGVVANNLGITGHWLVASGATNLHTIMYVGDPDAKFLVNGGYFGESSSSTTPQRAAAYFPNANGAVAGEFRGFPTGSLTHETSTFSAGSVIPRLARFGHSVNYLEMAGTKVITGTAAPASGTWAVGDRVINTAPAAGGASEWRCTTAGTPGTWKEINVAP